MNRDPFPLLETARLKLRCFASGDATATSTMMTPEVSRWVANWPLPFTHDMAAARIETMRHAAFRGDALPFAVVEKASGELAGWITIVRNAENRRRGSLGYWLGERHHRRGFMKESTPVTLRAGFDVLDLDVIEAGAQLDNAGSFAIMQACGMKPAGQGLVFAPARNRNELCIFYEIERLRPQVG
jgi:ribosomal-protein-alanine N-acetyltransferase